VDLKDMLDHTTNSKSTAVGWQLDPFGHSNTQAWLLSSKVGLNSMFFGRSDYRELNMRYANSSLEYLWQGSQSQPLNTRIFAAQLYGQGKYGVRFKVMEFTVLD
jgi:hypothetical protein